MMTPGNKQNRGDSHSKGSGDAPGFGPGSRRSGGGPGFGPGHGPGGMLPGEKARDFKGTMRKLVKALPPFRWSFLVAVIFASASTVFNIFGPKVLGKATTKLFEGAMAQITGT